MGIVGGVSHRGLFRRNTPGTKPRGVGDPSTVGFAAVFDTSPPREAVSQLWHDYQLRTFYSRPIREIRPGKSGGLPVGHRVRGESPLGRDRGHYGEIPFRLSHLRTPVVDSRSNHHRRPDPMGYSPLVVVSKTDKQLPNSTNSFLIGKVRLVMEDARNPQSKRTIPKNSHAVLLGQWLLLGLSILGLAGCSLFILAGKMFFGDPTAPAAFSLATGVDLTEGEKKVVVLCSAPSMVDDGDLSLNYTIVEDVSRRLKREGVALINSNDVRTWMDDNGGHMDDPRDLADEFDVDYIVYISLGRVSFQEENSPNLFRGKAGGEVFAYEVKKSKGDVMVNEVFSKSFTTTFPDFHPVSADQIDSPRIFKKRFLDRTSSHLAQLFYDHKISEEIY